MKGNNLIKEDLVTRPR